MIGLYNKVYDGLEDGNPTLTRLPDIRGRNTNQEVAKLVQGHLHRMFDLLTLWAAVSLGVGFRPGSSGKTGEGGRKKLQKMANWLLKMETPRCTAVPRHQQS